MRRGTAMLEIGLVKSLEDPDGQGRVQVEFPRRPDIREYPLVPIATPMAGGSRGMHFMPEPGDEVLVAFEHGDFAHPFIVGFLWNGADRPPETDYQNRVILTPGGHTLRFEDKDGSKRIVIRSSGGHEIELDDSSAGQSITITTNGQQKIVLDDKDHSIEIQGGGRSVAMRGGQFMIQ